MNVMKNDSSDLLGLLGGLVGVRLIGQAGARREER